MNSTAPRPAAPALLNVHALRKHYGAATVVDGVSFRIAPGECLGVIGPNGAGKTTTIRMCLGLTAPDGGSIHYQTGGGAPALSMPRDALAIKAQLGVVAQFDTLDPTSAAPRTCVCTPAISACAAQWCASAFRSCWNLPR